METRANYALIGGFTVAVIISIFLFILWFSGTNRPEATAGYRVLFNGSISGLSRGGAVLFNGVRVGEVTHIDLAPSDPSQVEALIAIDARVPVRADTKARLEYQGFTGVASLALTGGSPEAQPLPTPPDGGPGIIHADRSDFQDLIESARRIASQASDFLEKANGLVDANSPALNKTLKNAEKFSDALAANSDGIKDFMASMGDLGRTIKPLTADADRVVKSIDPERVKSIIAHADSFSGKLDAAGNKIEGVMDSLQSFLGSGDSKNALTEIRTSFADVGSAARSVRRAADNINKFASTGLRQYEALAVDGRRTLDTITQAVRSIENNPQQFLFGKKSSIPEYMSTR